MSAGSLLQLQKVEADIGGSRILRGVDLAVASGEVVALMGRNGVGKTTTLRVIMGLLPVRAGALFYDGRSARGTSTAGRARAGLGYVPQGRDIFPHLTVEENLYVGLLLHRRTKLEQKEELERVYTLFPVLPAMLKRKGGVLSGGQQQQLAIARALLTGPRLLLLDEPTEGIQPSIIEEIGETLLRLKRQGGIAILLVEQFVDFCRDVADRFYAMDRGAVTISGPVGGLTDEVVRQHLQV